MYMVESDKMQEWGDQKHMWTGQIGERGVNPANK